MHFILTVLEKSQRKNSRLIPKLVTVNRAGTAYQTTVWVLPSQSKSDSTAGDVQFDLFSEAEHDWREKLLEHVGSGTQVSFNDKDGTEHSGEVSFFADGVYKIISGKMMVKVSPEQITAVHPEKRPDKIAEIIKTATPENRASVQVSLFGSDMKDYEIGKYDFVPSSFTENEFAYKDYRDVAPVSISLIPDKGILDREPPSWIPKVSDEHFSSSGYRLEAVKVKENDYIVLKGFGTDHDYRVNADLLAVMQDYYTKRAKALAKKRYDYLVEKNPGRRVQKPSVRMCPENRATYSTLNAARDRLGPETSKWVPVRAAVQDMKQKLSDMNIQMEENLSTHAKGRSTAYGDAGTRKDLYDEFGVLVKRQNGDPISIPEVAQIKEALSSVFSVYGNRSSMARNFGLKVSHSGQVLQHARNACGVFFPFYHAIGVTAKYGDKGLGFTLAHEWAHFMDNYLGEHQGNRYHYASDDWSSLPGKIAKEFRAGMEKQQKSNYQNRTCECFARALEQYFATKTESVADYQEEWNRAGNHPKQAVFEEKIMPLVDRFFTENNEMLKAIDDKCPDPALIGFKVGVRRASKSLTFSGWKLQGRKKVNGMDISIENRKGTVRRGTDKDGHKWATKMHADYGYVRGSEGTDGDHVDVYLGPNLDSRRVFIITQNDPVTGSFDEQKVMLGFNSPTDAKALYMKQYDRPGFFGSMDETDIDTFKEKVLDKKNHGKKLVIRR